MKNIKGCLFLLFVFLGQCLSNKDEDAIQKILSSTEKDFEQSFLKEFKETPKETVSSVYFPYFLYKYGELTKQHSDIITYFKSINITEEPMQAYIFLRLWHRKLNNEKFNMPELVQMANDTTYGVKSCLNLKTINSVSNFIKLNLGDNIQLKFPVRIESNIKSTVYYGCPVLDWQYDTLKDLTVDSEIINKYYKPYYKDPTIAFYIQVKIKGMNRKDVLYFFDNVNQNDTIEVNLTDYGIKI